nr:MAG TPA: hypothetical protein [Caudoviricetes sp.]
MVYGERGGGGVSYPCVYFQCVPTFLCCGSSHVAYSMIGC